MSNALDSWRVDPREFPVSGTDAEKLQFLVHYAVLAPSKCNSQPWLFEICGDSLDLICDRKWAFRELDPEGRELILSCGAALSNLKVAAGHFGYSARVQPFPWAGDKYLLARVRLEKSDGAQLQKLPPFRHSSELNNAPVANAEARRVPTEEDLFEALKHRCTSRRSFQPRPPSAETMAAMEAAVASHDAWLHGIEEELSRRQIVELVAEGDRVQMANKGLRRELAKWVHSPLRTSLDGLPISRFGLPAPMTWLSPGVSLGLWAVDLGRVVALHDRRLAKNAPLLAVLGTQADTPAAWLSAGQALELLWLRATAAGLSLSVFSQPIAVPQLRAQLTRICGRDGFPQVLLRLGYGPLGYKLPGKHTPRRPPKEVII